MAKLPWYFKNVKTKHNPEKNSLDMTFDISLSDLFSIDHIRPILRKIFGNRKNYNRYIAIITQKPIFDNFLTIG